MKTETHLIEAFHRLVAKSMRDWHVPGLAIAVVCGDKIDAKGYGFAKYPDVRMRRDTIFDCASTSKSFTAAAISLLVDANESYPELHWRTPVSKLLPDFVLQDSYATANVTIEDILSHRSGMPRHDESYMGSNAGEPDTPESITRNLRNLPLSRPLRTECQYCNMMYTVASHLVVTVSGRPFEDFLKDRIWNPLEMLDTRIGMSAKEALDASHQLAQGYCWDEEKQEHYAVPWLHQPEGQGAGSIFSSAHDYAKWIRMMINRAGPISKAGHQDLVKPRVIAEADVEDSPKPFHSHLLYALGWEIENYRGYTVIGHGGCVSGFGSLMRYLPQLEWGIVIFGNADGANEVAEILCWHLIDELLGVPASERFDWDEFARQQEESYADEQREDLYPERPDPPLPMLACLQSYVGRYRNAGYHDLVVDLQDGRLHVDAKDRSFGFDLWFEHVSGEHFIAENIYMVDGDKERMKARFLHDSSGGVQSLGIAFVKEMEDPMIWFTKVES